MSRDRACDQWSTETRGHPLGLYTDVYNMII